MSKEFVIVTLREQPYTFRALDLDQLEALETQFNQLQEAAQTEGVPKGAAQAVAEIATASLQAKHEGITVEQVRKLITIATMPLVMAAIKGINNPEGDEPGEAPAAP